MMLIKFLIILIGLVVHLDYEGYSVIEVEWIFYLGTILYIGLYSKLILKSKDDFKGRHFNGLMIIQALTGIFAIVLAIEV